MKVNKPLFVITIVFIATLLITSCAAREHIPSVQTNFVVEINCGDNGTNSYFAKDQPNCNQGNCEIFGPSLEQLPLQLEYELHTNIVVRSKDCKATTYQQVNMWPQGLLADPNKTFEAFGQ